MKNAIRQNGAGATKTVINLNTPAHNSLHNIDNLLNRLNRIKRISLNRWSACCTAQEAKQQREAQ